MNNNITISVINWDKLYIKSEKYNIKIASVLKAACLETYYMWESDFENQQQTKENWIQYCKYIEQKYRNSNKINLPQLSFVISEDEKAIVFENIKENTMFNNCISSIIEALINLIERLSILDWNNKILCLIPESQRKERIKVNNTMRNIKDNVLFSDFCNQALKYPQRKALLIYNDEGKNVLSYGDLYKRSLQVAEMLTSCGVKEGDFVSVILPKGLNQIIAVLGILFTGAAYVPIGINQPTLRKEMIIRKGDIKYVLTSKDVNVEFNENILLKKIYIEDLNNFIGNFQHKCISSNSIAYVIFTSGTTGEAKGVLISHRSAYNTISDVNRRFNITSEDSIIGISELDFDLSVYDILGILSVGGKLIVMNEKIKKEPFIWNKIIKDNNVTIWNSVPAIFDMLLTVNEIENSKLPLKKIFVSGDWVDVNLFNRMKSRTENCKFIALGGATEASIWSNYYEVKDTDILNSFVPYGYPLANQEFRVVNTVGGDCPDYVKGELWIGGEGVAKGYLNDKRLTQDRFVIKDAKPWYKTGDFGRYINNGVIEFLGRKDNQIKLNGYRIEAGEVESALKKHKAINKAMVSLYNSKDSKKLVAFITPKFTSKENKTIQLFESNTKNRGDIKIDLYEKTVESFMLELYQYIDFNLEAIKQKRIKNTFNLWNEWLIRRNVIEVNENKVVQGKRYEEVKNNIECQNNVLGKELFKNIDIYKSIIIGKSEPYSLLEKDNLSPELLLCQDDGILSGIDLIIKDINSKLVNIKGDMKIAILNSGTGLIVEKMISKLNKDVKFTLFHESLSMLEKSRKRLLKYDSNVDYKLVNTNLIDTENLYEYDVVVAVGTLHRYVNPFEGLNVSNYLLKDDGALYALEYTELNPIALIVSALLEEGFVKFNNTRRKKCNPLLETSEWIDIFKKSQFDEITFTKFNYSKALYIKAFHTNSRKIKETLKSNSINDYLNNKLPKYMIPEQYIILPYFPLGKNGKVDINSILKTIENKENQISDTCFKTDLEEEIANIWNEMTHYNSVGRQDSFFEIGGDSLLATRFLAIVKEKYYIDLTLKEIFENPKLYKIAEKIEELSEEIGDIVEGEI